MGGSCDFEPGELPVGKGGKRFICEGREKELCFSAGKEMDDWFPTMKLRHRWPAPCPLSIAKVTLWALSGLAGLAGLAKDCTWTGCVG